MSQKPRSWFVNKVKAINMRLTGLKHFKNKPEILKDSVKQKAIDQEIAAAELELQRTRLISNFAELEEI